MAYLENRYIQPDAGKLREFGQQVRGIGNNLNQLARLAHIGNIDRFDPRPIQQQLYHLQEKVDRAFHSPPNLLEEVAKAIAASPAFADQLKGLLKRTDFP
jgi:hypothetical protein